MAGQFPDFPAPRFDLANDGTMAFARNVSAGGAQVDVTAQLAAVTALEVGNVIGVTGTSASSNLTFLFPELRNLRGVYWQLSRDGLDNSVTPSATYSLDTTDGLNGTWTSVATHGGRASVLPPYPFYRTSFATLALDGVKGFRLQITTPGLYGHQYRTIHLYGWRTSLERVAFWDPVADTELAGPALDFGDAVRGAIHGPRQFRVKNLSPTKTATGMTVTAADLMGSGFGENALQVSSDNVSWGVSTPAITLTPGQISPVMYARLNLDANLMAQARSGRLRTSMTGWA